MIISKFKNKIGITVAIHSDKHTQDSLLPSHYKIDNNIINIQKTTTENKYACWCFLVIDEVVIEAKIVHKGRGKFKIIDDKCNGKYIYKVVDASDVVRCRTDV